jgi:hypothetical protein
MKSIIQIPIKPLSINEMYCRNRSYTSTSYKQWLPKIFHFLSNDEHSMSEFKKIRDNFDPKKEAFLVNINWFYPKEILYTKQGIMSARAHDLTNIEKPLVDLIFLPKFYKTPSPYGCKNINQDDKFIKKVTSEQFPHDSFLIELEIEIINSDDYNEKINKTPIELKPTEHHESQE